MDVDSRLAAHTTLRVGGPADSWHIARSDDDLIAAVTGADRAGRPVLLLGGGSNLLVADDGFRGTVVAVDTRGITVSESSGDEVSLTAAAGEVWDDVVSQVVSHGWSGIEALSGIPGRVGATPVQNVGAYGQEVAQVITCVRVLDRRSGAVSELRREECGFAYRSSALKQDPHRWVVLSVTMRLRADGVGTVAYTELAEALGTDVGGTVDVRAVRGAVLALRARKGMVLSEADHDTWSAGSFFTNPVVSEAQASLLPEQCPRYPAPDGVKASAAWLIGAAGIERGFALPGSRAAISTRHALALCNRGGATAAEIVDLAREVRARVAAEFGITLEPEPVLVGLSL